LGKYLFMYYEPQILDKYLIRSLYRLSEEDCQQAHDILSKRLSDFKNDNYYLEIPIVDLPLNTRACNLLVNSGLETVGSVISCGYDKLKFLRGMGSDTIALIKIIIDRIIEKKDEIRGLSGQVLYDFLSAPEKQKQDNSPV
jgi:DNA-directed RNA polymerase alpha subunit